MQFFFLPPFLLFSFCCGLLSRGSATGLFFPLPLLFFPPPTGKTESKQESSATCAGPHRQRPCFLFSSFFPVINKLRGDMKRRRAWQLPPFPSLSPSPPLKGS